MSVAQAICTLQLLVSTALLAKVFAANEKLERVGKPSLCKMSNEAANYNYTCGQISGGVVSYARLLNERCCIYFASKFYGKLIIFFTKHDY
jgi:hypothetical protein